MKKVKSACQRITAGVLALVFTVILALPKAKAVTGVDDVSVGIMAVLVHLESIGGSLAVKQGTALATQNAVTALATQAGAAGALGAGVTGTAALATIGGACVAAAAGGFTIGYIGYETLSKLAEWIRQSKLTGTAENKIYQTGGSFDFLTDGRTVRNGRLSNDIAYDFGKIYTTQAGSSFMVSFNDDGKYFNYQCIGLTPDNSVKVESAKTSRLDSFPSGNGYYILSFNQNYLGIGASIGSSYEISIPSIGDGVWYDVFLSGGSSPEVEKQEVTYTPPATWAPPAPAPGQDVYYNPYPNAPQKPIKEIVEDVPKDIYDKKFDPAPPSILDPSVPPIDPPVPDIPPVNPNPDVNPPEEVQPYTVRLGDVFPFCIPFDVYHMVTLFAAEPEAPHAKWEFSLPFTGGTYHVEWDLREWDEVAALCRKLELILFCVGLAVVTYKYIKW